MTSRESRKQRREAERKARKLANKEVRFNPPQSLAPETPAPSPHPAATRLAEMRAKADRELEDEFGAEFLDRIARQAGLCVSPRPRADVNRQNATLSTGPRTLEGKLASSRNSLKHGLSTGALLIPGEDQSAFEALRDTLLREHQPADTTEEMLVTELAQSYWLLQRALRYQNECFTLDGVDEKRLALFLRYGSTHERAFHKALNTLLRLQKDRRQTQSPSAGFVSQRTGASSSVSQPLSQNAAFEGLDAVNFSKIHLPYAHETEEILSDAA